MRFQQLKRDPNAVMRKRLVKSKKSWVVISGLSLAGALFLLTAPSYVVKADATVDVKTQTTIVVPNAMPPKTADVSLKNPNPKITGDKKASSATPEDPNKNDEQNSLKKPITDVDDASKNSTVKNLSNSDTEQSAIKNFVNDDKKDEALKPSKETKGLLSLFQISKNKGKKPQVAKKPQESIPSNTDKNPQTSVPTNTDDVNESSHETDDSVIVNATGANDKDKFVKKNSGTGWNVDDSGKILNIIGKLNKGTGADHERWGGNTQNITTINIAVPIVAPENSAYLFANMENLKKIDHIKNLNTEQIENAEGMFKNDTSLETLDLSAHTIPFAHNISHMFENDKNIKTITFKKASFIRIKDASYAFANDTSLTDFLVKNNKGNIEKGLSATDSWKAVYATDLRSMFKNDINLTTLNLDNWFFDKADTGDSSKGEGMFDGTSLKSIVLNDNLVFNANTALTSQDGITWTSVEDKVEGNIHDPEVKQSFSGIPTFDKDGKAISGIGSLYKKGAVVQGWDSHSKRATGRLTYIASGDGVKGQSINNLVTIPTNQGDITINAPGSLGNSSTVDVPTTWTFNGVTYTKKNSSPNQVKATFDKTQSSTDTKIVYVKARSEDTSKPAKPSTTVGPSKPVESNTIGNSEKTNTSDNANNIMTSDGSAVVNQVEPSKAPEPSKTPEAPKAPEEPKVPEAPKAPEEPKVPEAPKAPEPSKTPEEPKVPETPKAPEPSKTPEEPKVPEAPKAPEEPKVPEAP
ncbi:hypothetical protein ACFQAV_12965, partial [Companilactobacillus huachuanensis]